MRQIVVAFVFCALSLPLGCAGGDAVRDNQPPRVENLQIQPSNLIASGTQVTVQATVTDDRGIREVSVEVTYPDGQERVITMIRQGDNQFSATFSAQWNERMLPQDYESWVIRFVVTAIDNFGNRFVSDEIRVKAAIGPPELPPDF
ncbi:MAG: hypothetical protein N3B10_03005 [Armatimonadetes bacterium]|nr:hypothetical protein [Armatimonadota bacterium]